MDLMNAAASNDVARLSALLAKGTAVDHADALGRTALMMSSFEGRIACVQALLDAGASSEPEDVIGCTALILASSCGHVDCVRALLEAGAAVNHINGRGISALMLASSEGRLECVRALLEARADVNKSDNLGWNALMLASAAGQVKCASALLEAGANLSCFSAGGASALVCGRHHRGMVQLLCAHGAQRSDLLSVAGPELNGLPDDCRAWLLETQSWTSELHHFGLLPAARVRALIIGGADLHASDRQRADSPTPLTLARAALALDAAHERARLVVEAAAPWSRRNHALFPQPARARAVSLLLLGHALAREGRFAGEASAVLDVWQEHVMAHAVERSSTPYS